MGTHNQDKMNRLAFARKYRPQDFEELIDQNHIATTLKNAIAQDKLAHAYLFAGPRGIGKTSAARILAKALNCKKGPTTEPCNKCVACQEIAEGRSMDVLEIDGASNRGIDEIRVLRENVKFSPSSGRFKIYIIDEVHMLTTEAFNALLKTLEEPPAHVKFIFATTEPHKVLPTILSRCQRFDFHKISTPGIVAKLKKLAKEEEISFEEEALFAIAKSAEGSLRDAEVILDQINNFSRGQVKLEDVNSVLGLVSQDAVFTLTEKLNARHLPENLVLLDKLIKDGKEPGQLVLSLLEHFRQLMLMKCGCSQIVDLSKEEKEQVKKQGENFGLENILYCLSVLAQTQERMKKQANSRVLLEMALVKLSEQDTLLTGGELREQVNRLEEKLGNLSAAQPVKKDTPRSADDAFSGCSVSLSKPAEAVESLKTKQAKQKTENTDSSPDKQDIADKSANKKPTPPAVIPEHTDNPEKALVSLEIINKSWPKIIEAVKKKKMSLGLYLAEGQPLAVEKNIVKIGFLKEHEFHRENLEQSDNLLLIEQLSSEITACKVNLKFIGCDELPNSKKDTETEEAMPQPGSMEEEGESGETPKISEFIQSAVDIFNGHIIPSEE